MSNIIVIRTFQAGDELRCHETVQDGVWASMHNTFFGFIFKEVTFQAMILLAAIMFIFFGIPITFCVTVIPIIIALTYVATYGSFATIAMSVENEIRNAERVYMSNAFSCFWVAEAYEMSLMVNDPKDIHFIILPEKQFLETNINTSLHRKKIVGTIGLSKSYNSSTGAWIKRLFVAQKYRRKGIASCLLNTAVYFAIDQGYSSACIAASEHNDGGRELCFKKGFELKQMYNKTILGPLLTILMYELIYQIKQGDDNYGSCFRDYND